MCTFFLKMHKQILTSKVQKSKFSKTVLLLLVTIHGDQISHVEQGFDPLCGPITSLSPWLIQFSASTVQKIEIIKLLLLIL